MGGNSSSAGGNYQASSNRAYGGNDTMDQSLPNSMPSSNHLHNYTAVAQDFLKQQEVKKLAREKNLNLHGKLIKSKLSLDIKSLVLKQSSTDKNRYYPRFKYGANEDVKISIYYCCNQMTNAEGVPMYFTIPSDLPPAGIIEVEEGLDQMYDKIKSTSFDITQYENMPLFNATMSYYPCVITIEPQAKPIVGEDGVSDYQNLITYCVFQINKTTNLIELKPFRQVLVAFDMAFNLQQIYGITDAVEDNKEESMGMIAGDDSQLWVVCMTEEKNTVVMPCGHLWVCKDCATTIAAQRSPDWPICRLKVKSFVPLNINSIKQMESTKGEKSTDVGDGVKI